MNDPEPGERQIDTTVPNIIGNLHEQEESKLNFSQIQPQVLEQSMKNLSTETRKAVKKAKESKQKLLDT